MPSRWIEHVKEFAKKNNMSYGCALSDPNLKKGYVPTGDKKRKPEKLEMATPSTEPKPKNIVIKPRPTPAPKSAGGASKTYFGIDLSKYKEPYKAPPQPPKAPTPEPAQKKKRGIQEYEILDRQGLRDLFDRYYNAGDDEFRLGTLKAPNGLRYNEEDFNTFVGSFEASKKEWKQRWEPLAKKLKKMGYINFS